MPGILLIMASHGNVSEVLQWIYHNTPGAETKQIFAPASLSFVQQDTI